MPFECVEDDHKFKTVEVGIGEKCCRGSPRCRSKPGQIGPISRPIYSFIGVKVNDCSFKLPEVSQLQAHLNFIQCPREHEPIQSDCDQCEVDPSLKEIFMNQISLVHCHSPRPEEQLPEINFEEDFILNTLCPSLSSEQLNAMKSISRFASERADTQELLQCCYTIDSDSDLVTIRSIATTKELGQEPESSMSTIVMHGWDTWKAIICERGVQMAQEMFKKLNKYIQKKK